MASTVPLKVAIYQNPGIKHWSLFIDAAEMAKKTIIHLLGARRKYFIEVRARSDANISNSLIELCPLCEIDASNVEAVKIIAQETPIRNEVSDYSCQDFILEVLDKLETSGVIPDNADYQTMKRILKEKREAWK